MATVQPRFGAWDYVVLTIVLLISSAIGVYYRFTGGKQKTMKVHMGICVILLVYYSLSLIACELLSLQI